MSQKAVDILNALSQAAGMFYDGAHVKKYTMPKEFVQLNFKREEGDPMLDKRCMDGARIKITGHTLCVTYNILEESIERINNMGRNKYVDEIAITMMAYINKLKSKAKEIYGSAIELKAIEKEPDVVFQYLNRTRSSGIATWNFNIPALEKEGILNVGGEDQRSKEFTGLGVNDTLDNQKTKLTPNY